MQIPTPQYCTPHTHTTILHTTYQIPQYCTPYNLHHDTEHVTTKSETKHLSEVSDIVSQIFHTTILHTTNVSHTTILHTTYSTPGYCTQHTSHNVPQSVVCIVVVWSMWYRCVEYVLRCVVVLSMWYGVVGYIFCVIVVWSMWYRGVGYMLCGIVV